MYHCNVKMIVHWQLESELRTTGFIGGVFMPSELRESWSVPGRLLSAQIPLCIPWGLPVSSLLFSETVIQAKSERKKHIL